MHMKVEHVSQDEFEEMKETSIEVMLTVTQLSWPILFDQLKIRLSVAWQPTHTPAP